VKRNRYAAKQRLQKGRSSINRCLGDVMCRQWDGGSGSLEYGKKEGL
jgi:hypothetical protein